MQRFRCCMAILAGVVVAGCSDSTGPAPIECTLESTRTLAVGEHRILDPSVDGACVRLPAAGAGGAEHLYVPLATAGAEAANGISAAYLVSGVGSPTTSPSALRSPVLSAFQRPLPPETFHSMLRARERELSRDGSGVMFNWGRHQATAAVPPVKGDQRNFFVCSTSTCRNFVQTTATARSVGQRVAIFVDNAAPAGGYTDPDLDRVRTLFDQFLYPIDTIAFGRESDVDGNGVVDVLLTPRVNALSPNCNTTGRIILGYFFGADLMPLTSGNPGSNEAEVFYGLVPDPDNTGCTVSLTEANQRLPTTFIHEFQHMISYNQHVLLRGGTAEDTWLNEGLSHFAEELGGRQIPDAECPSSPSCGQEFEEGDLDNAFHYLASPEDFFLIEPRNSTGKLEERGANWLFVRWLADNFAADTILGVDMTHALVQTNLLGSTNVSTWTGVDFSTLVGEWQLANYLDDLPGFSAPGARLQYTSWNFRLVADTNQRAFPLVPDSTNGTDYGHSGILRAGSGRHVRVVQLSGAAAVDLRLTGTGGGALPGSIDPRIALVRIR